MRHRRHRLHAHRGRWPLGPWRLAHSIHRRLLTYLLVAVGLGLASGWVLHHASAGGVALGGRLIPPALLLALVWPLAWLATFRIARPVADLARVAHELRAGRLQTREQLRADAEGEVGEVAGALRGMADRVARQLADQRALMAAVSHELRSPLARVRVLVELAREGQATGDVYDDLQAEVDAMDALVADLLAAARIDFDAVAPVALDASEVAARALEQAGLSRDLLAVEVGDTAVEADPTLLARALAVLLDNAVRHAGGASRLLVGEQDGALRLAVEDAGPGFEAGEEEQIFQPFWRRPTESGGAPVPGVGLGLALVRQIAHAHGGEAGAANLPGGGAVVWMTLPRAH